jgi:hypothetical protein
MMRDARQAVRLPLRAPAVLAFAAGHFEVIAEDLAADGCGFVSPLPLRRGEAVHLTIRLPGAPPLSAHATVAWAQAGLPHRAGVSFTRSGAAARVRQLRSLLQDFPALDQPLPPLRPGAVLRLVRPPGAREHATREERTVLQAAAAGVTALELLRTTTGAGVRRALLLLRARGVVAEGSPPPGAARATATSGESAPGPDPLAGPLSASRIRPSRATAYFEMARGEQAAGHLTSGVEWLQAAGAASPEDSEIQEALDALTLRGEP